MSGNLCCPKELGDGCGGAQPAEFGVLLDGCVGSLPVDAPERIESFTSDHEPASELEDDLSQVWRTGGCFCGVVHAPEDFLPARI